MVRHKRKQVKPYSLPGSKNFKQALKEGAKVRLQPVKLTHSDIAFLQYTGGTTGVAKGAMLTHGNMIANVLQALEWIGPSFAREPATLITALPLYHIFALTANCLLFVAAWLAQRAHHQSARFPGVRCRDAQVQVHLS